MVGSVPVGGDAPISVQTMTITTPSDPMPTIAQLLRCQVSFVFNLLVSTPNVESTASLVVIITKARSPIVAPLPTSASHAA